MLKPLTTSNSAHSTTHRANRHYAPDRDSSVSEVFLVVMSRSESSHFYFFSPPPPMALSDTGRFSPLPTFCRSYPNSQHSHTHTPTLAHWDFEFRFWYSTNGISYHWIQWTVCGTVHFYYTCLFGKRKHTEIWTVGCSHAAMRFMRRRFWKFVWQCACSLTAK